jgi:hypothetical protein
MTWAWFKRGGLKPSVPRDETNNVGPLKVWPLALVIGCIFSLAMRARGTSLRKTDGDIDVW